MLGFRKIHYIARRFGAKSANYLSHIICNGSFSSSLIVHTDYNDFYERTDRPTT